MEAVEIEAKIQAVWQSILGIGKIGPYQTFFELGGDSVSMIDMVAKTSTELGMEIDPGWLFEDPSLRGFATRVASSKG
jgi:acyl carrier protein